MFPGQTLIIDDFLKKRNVEKSQPMNIVIKIRSADGQPCVKISDDLSKNTGLDDQVRWVKEQLGLLRRDRKSIDEGNGIPGRYRQLLNVSEKSGSMNMEGAVE
jgi:nicotinic acid phosphoribosyltransferase